MSKTSEEVKDAMRRNSQKAASNNDNKQIIEWQKLKIESQQKEIADLTDDLKDATDSYHYINKCYHELDQESEQLRKTLEGLIGVYKKRATECEGDEKQQVIFYSVIRDIKQVLNNKES